MASAAVAGAVLAGVDVTPGEDPAVPAAIDDESAAPLEIEALAAPGAPGREALSSTWYCAGGTATGEGMAEQTVVVANPTSKPVEGSLTVFTGRLALPLADPAVLSGNGSAVSGAAAAVLPSTTTTTTPALARGRGEPTSHAFRVPAQSRRTFRLAELTRAQLASALVEVDSGGVAVEHLVEGDSGSDIAPCSVTASDSWHFAWGATTRDAREVLVLFNPFPSDVVVDATFATDRGDRTPRRWKGLLVPGRSVVGVDVGVDVTRRTDVAATIEARNGRLIVDRLQAFDGRLGTGGLSVARGHTAPGEDWLFAHGRVVAGTSERIVLYNPGDEVAEVRVGLEGIDREHRRPQPFGVVVRPGDYEIVDYDREMRVEKGVSHATSVHSTNGVPVVAERIMTFGAPPLSASASPRRDVSVAPGSAVASNEWAFPVAGRPGEERGRYMIVNPSSTREARVTVTLFDRGRAIDVAAGADPDHAVAATVATGQRARLEIPAAELDRVSSNATVVVRSDAPVVAERTLVRHGLTTTVGTGIPLGATTVALATFTD
jgi:hypothetical protein